LIQFVGGTCSAAEAAELGVPLANCAKASNVANVRNQGFELEAGTKPWDWLYVETGYLYLDARDLDTGSS
jgi:outer membrane receptor protein involved in Fe transport